MLASDRERIRKQINEKLHNYDQLSKSNEWRKIIDRILEYYRGTEYETIIRMKYFDKASEPEILQCLHIERSSYYGKVWEIITDIAIMAASRQIQILTTG